MHLEIAGGAGVFCWLLQYLRHMMVSSRLPARVGLLYPHVTTKPAATSKILTFKLCGVSSSLKEGQVTMISRHEVWR